MKKFTVIFIIISSLVFFNKTIISKVIIFTLSKKIDRNINIKNINIDYSKKKITLTSIEVKSNSKIYYKNIFEAENIEIEYDFKSLFTDLIIINHLIFYNPKIFVDIDMTNTEISKDNLDEVRKQEENYKPKIWGP